MCSAVITSYVQVVMSVLHFSTPSLLYGLWHEATAFIITLDGGNIMEVAM